MKKTIINVLTPFCSLFILFIILEISARVYYGEYRFINFLYEIKKSNAHPFIYDQELGWIPEEGTYMAGKTRTTILEDGIRVNEVGNSFDLTDNSELILAVGDSFTYGSEVSDDETWPALLGKISGKRVINGGVFGYGIDQIFLRMKKLIKKYKPDIVIFSLIVRDIERAELSHRYNLPKPYFEISNDKLVLRDKHLSASPLNSPMLDLDIERRILGYSFAVHKFMLFKFARFWMTGATSGNSTYYIGPNGQKISCLIFRDMKDYLFEHGVNEGYILFQYTNWLDTVPKKFGKFDNVIKCIDTNVLSLVDLRNDLIEARKNNENRYRTFFGNTKTSHMTKEGNYFVAQVLNEAINHSHKKNNEHP